jgi:CubicO group peptidase (beta-lactamase class C family)
MTRHLLAMLLLSCLVPPAMAAPGKGDTLWMVDASQAERIRRVEAGLPAVALPEGKTLQLGLEQWMDFFHIPGVSIAVFDDFRVVWRKSYGLREAGTSLPVTLDTTFQAGSVSKPVTAMAVMHFVQEGKFSLDADINTQLISWKLPENEFTTQQKVTLRRLLSHSGGTTVHGFPGYAVGGPVPTTVQVLNGEKPANTAPVRVFLVPGAKYEYSGGGTTIVQLMLVDHLKKPFPQIMSETVLQPLGLKHSSYEQPQPPARALDSATGHRPGGKPVDGKWHVYPEMAAAGLWTTPGDLAEVAIEMAKSKHGKSNRVLSQATTEQMLTLQMAPVGLGFFLGPAADQFGHDGSDEGFLTTLVAFSDSGKGVAVMANSDLGFALFGPLEASIAKEYGWTGFVPPPTPPFIRFAIVSKQVGVEKAIADYASLRARGPQKDFHPGDLNACGYALLTAGETADAIRVFQANVALYPEEANGYDSLGEGYMTAGNRELAIKNYQIALKLNPKNANAVEMLAKLGAPTADAGTR